METGRDSFDGGNMLCLSSSNAVLPWDSLELRASSEGLELPLSYSSLSSLVPAWSLVMTGALRESCTSRLLVFVFFKGSISDDSLERFGIFVRGPCMA